MYQNREAMLLWVIRPQDPKVYLVPLPCTLYVNEVGILHKEMLNIKSRRIQLFKNIIYICYSQRSGPVLISNRDPLQDEFVLYKPSYYYYETTDNAF